MNPPPPPPPKRAYTLADIQRLRQQQAIYRPVYTQAVPDMSAVSDVAAKVAQQFAAFGEAFATFNQIDDEFKPIGYLSETGIEK